MSLNGWCPSPLQAHWASLGCCRPHVCTPATLFNTPSRWTPSPARPTPSTAGVHQAGIKRGGGAIQPLWLAPPQKGSIDGPPESPTETEPRAPEVTRTQNSAKNENGIFGISASRRFRKFTICCVFGEKNHFPCSKIFAAPLVPEFIIAELN